MSRGRLILIQAAIFVGGLLSLEALARIAFTIQRDLAAPQPWYRLAKDVGWERRPGFTGYDDCNKARSFDERGLVAADAARLTAPREAQFRVLFLGDSNTYGYCIETSYTYPEVAARLLPGLVPVNLGVSGYTSFQGLRALRQWGATLAPQMIFVSFNFNDRRMAVGDGQGDSEAEFARYLTADRILRLTGKSYLLGYLKGLTAGLLPAPPVATGTVPQVSLDKAHPRVDAQSYRNNLVAMAEWAKARGIPVAFILLGDNWEDTYLLREAAREAAEKRFEEAIASLVKVRDDPDHGVRWFAAVARLELARLYKETGRVENAAEAVVHRNAFVSAHGGLPIVADSVYQAIMREVARQYDAPVIDVASELSTHDDYYFDFCHFDTRGHELVGRLVAKAVEAEMKRRAGRPQ